MEIKRKYVFDDLNSFVDKGWAQLYNHELTFCNQVIGTNEMFFGVTSSMAKLEMVYNRVINLKLLQDWTDWSLNEIENCHKLWEKLLHDFENKCECCCALVLYDPSRTEIYQLVDKILTTLVSCHEIIDAISCEKTKNLDMETEPCYLVVEIIQRNVLILEKLYFQIQKLQQQVNLSDFFIRQINIS